MIAPVPRRYRNAATGIDLLPDVPIGPTPRTACRIARIACGIALRDPRCVLGIAGALVLVWLALAVTP